MSGKWQQGATQSEDQRSLDSVSDGARCGNVQHAAAKDGYRFLFRLSPETARKD
jgi:hypothetical protein